MPRAQSPWAHRAFWALWFGTLAARLGNQIAVIALTWLVLRTTGSGARIGITLSLYAVGDMAASPFVGILLDRLPRRALLMVGALLLAGIFVALAATFSSHHLPFGGLLASVVVAGALLPLTYLGRMIILPNLVGAAQWESANTAMQFNMNLVTLLGPALGGVLVTVVGISGTVCITALGYLLYAGCLLVIPRFAFRTEAPAGSLSLRSDLTVGWRFLREVPLLAVLTAVTLLFSLTYGPLEPALPVLVRTVFHGGPETLGFFWSAFAVGALIGTAVWGWLRPAWSIRFVVAGIIVAWGIFSGALGLLGHAWLAMVSLALGGLTYAPYNILYATWRQRLVPDALRGKVFGAVNSLTGIGLPIGQALGGMLIALVGASHTVLLGGMACVALGVVVYTARPLWAASTLPLPEGTASTLPTSATRAPL